MILNIGSECMAGFLCPFQQYFCPFRAMWWREGGGGGNLPVVLNLENWLQYSVNEVSYLTAFHCHPTIVLI